MVSSLINFLRTIKYNFWYNRNKTRFKSLGKGTVILSPLQINGKNNISLGERVVIGYKSWLAAVAHTGEKECLLQFGNGCAIGNFNHIYATKKIVLGNDVQTADKVYISDNIHDYEDINVPVMRQKIRQLREVYIGDGSWLGENVCVIGAVIGRNCVIGANAVVTKDIPDYSVAVGIPAKIIKRYCFDTQTWRKTNAEGHFI